MGRSIIRYYFSDDEFIMKWMSNSLVVTPFLKIIRKPVLMLINHAPSVSSTATGPVRKKEIKCVLMIIPFFRAWHLLLAFLRITYNLYTRWKSKLTACVLSLLVSRVLKRPFFAGDFCWNRPCRFYFPNPDQRKFSRDFAFFLFISYVRICTWIARLM